MARKSNLDLAREKRDFLERERVLTSDPSQKFELDERIEELNSRIARLERSSSVPNSSLSPAGPSAPPASGSTSGKEGLGSPAPPWWLLSLGIALATFALAWWLIGSVKIAAVLALAAGALMLLRNPEYLYVRIASIALGLLVTINAFNLTGFWEGKFGESRFRIELTEPESIVSIGLVVVIVAAMYFHANRR